MHFISVMMRPRTFWEVTHRILWCGFHPHAVRLSQFCAAPLQDVFSGWVFICFFSRNVNEVVFWNTPTHRSRRVVNCIPQLFCVTTTEKGSFKVTPAVSMSPIPRGCSSGLRGRSCTHTCVSSLDVPFVSRELSLYCLRIQRRTPRAFSECVGRAGWGGLVFLNTTYWWMKRRAFLLRF